MAFFLIMVLPRSVMDDRTWPAAKRI